MSAVDRSRLQHCHVFKKNLLFRYECEKCMNNSHILALLDILKQIGVQDSYQEVYRDTETFLRDYLEKTVFQCPGQRFLFLALFLRKVQRVIKKTWNKLRARAARL